MKEDKIVPREQVCVCGGGGSRQPQSARAPMQLIPMEYLPEGGPFKKEDLKRHRILNSEEVGKGSPLVGTIFV